MVRSHNGLWFLLDTPSGYSNVLWFKPNKTYNMGLHHSASYALWCYLTLYFSVPLTEHFMPSFLTHWCRVTHMCDSKLTIMGSDNGLLPGRRQAIIWTNVGMLLIQTLGTIFCEIFSEIPTFLFKKMHLKMSSGKWWPSCHGLNVLNPHMYY